jgi:nucleotide-binding universal stress UspA family protein
VADTDLGIHVESQQPKYQYRSLLEPEITVTNPSGEKVRPSKPGVHPDTNYDHGPANGNVSDANESEDEHDLTDIKQAQKLSFAMTPIISQDEHHRAVRMIYRGEYHKIVKNLEEEHQRIRKYLVATDLSEESTHALEWAIGTVLRDGDTLIAIYCVDEETGIVSGDAALVPDDSKAMKEQAAAIGAAASTKSPLMTGFPIPVQRSSVLTVAGESISSVSLSPAPSAGSRERNKGAEERQRAVKDISDRVTRLLRKTQLQVRVVVEVIHCKNPKHLITEVIDYINPTLVILGSRGRSALKG